MLKPLTSPRIVARAERLERLDGALAAVIAGGSAALLVAGEAGVGKSRLVQEFLDRARATGAETLSGGCLDVEEGRLPFGPFVEALRPLARDLDARARHELFEPGADELARLLPELRPGGWEPGGSLVQGRLFELVLGLLGRLAVTAPVVLVVEDLHWADRSTCDLLAFLVRNLRDERVLLLATYRSDELHRGHPLRPFLAELERSRRVDRLELPPLTRAEVADLLAAIRGAPADEALLEWTFERSEGNPFFVEELLAAPAPHGRLPPTLRDILVARAEHLSEAAQALLRVAAVGGRRVPDRLLAEVSALPDELRLATLREAVAHQLLVADDAGLYGFRHALAREAVYEELLPEERTALHAAYATALSARPQLADDEATVAGDLAHHWYAAHDVPRALAAAVAAGAAAARRSGFDEARRHYERALELWDRVPDAEARAGLDRVALTRCAAEAANLAGDHGRAASLIRGAIAGVDSRAAPALAGVMGERLGRFLWAAGDSEAAVLAYEEAVRLVPAQPPSAARARVLAARGQSLMLLGRYRESSACCRDAIAIARTVGARAEEGHALNTLGCDLVFLGDPDGAVSHLEQSRQVAEAVGDLDDLCRAYLNLSDVLAGPLNRLEESVAVAREGYERAVRAGLAGDYGVSLQTNAATALLAMGRLEEATELLQESERRNPAEMAAIDLHLIGARIEVRRGVFAAAQERLVRLRALMHKTIDPPYRASLQAIEAELALWRGHPGEAAAAVSAGLRLLDGTDDLWREAPLLWLGLWAHGDAVFSGERDATDAGRALLERAHGLVARAPCLLGVTRGYVLLCEAEGSRAAGTGDTDAWQRARGAWHDLGQPYLEAYCGWRLAETLLAARRARQGRVALAAAHALASSTGARLLAHELRLLAQRARIDLDAAPAPMPPTADERDAILTPRQFEVLALVATGATNREIAERLFITEKTAGAHVSAILARLGLRSRVQAATAAQRFGLLASGDGEREPAGLG